MIRINLIPEDYLRKPPSAAPAVLVVLILLAGVLYWAYSDMSKARSNVATLQDEVAKLDTEIKKLEAVAKEIEKRETEREGFNKRTQIINEVVVSRILWSRKLFEMCHLVPESIWLTKVEASTSKKTAKGGAARSAARGGKTASGKSGTQVETERSIVIEGIVLSSKDEKADEKSMRAIGTFMNNLSGLKGLEGAVQSSPEAVQAMLEERKVIEERNGAVMKAWEDNQNAVVKEVSDESILSPADYDRIVGLVYEAVRPTYSTITADDVKAIHASRSFAGDFFEAGLVVIEDALYADKPVKEFAIKCRAKPRVKEESADEKKDDTRGGRGAGKSGGAKKAAPAAANKTEG